MSYIVADGDKVIPRGAFARNYDISEIYVPDFQLWEGIGNGQQNRSR